MIAPDAQPIGHRSPYKRIDLAQRRTRKAVVTQDDIKNGEPIPDPSLYEYWIGDRAWRLKP